MNKLPEIQVGDIVTDYIRGREVTPLTVEWWNASPLAKPDRIERNGVALWQRAPAPYEGESM